MRDIFFGLSFLWLVGCGAQEPATIEAERVLPDAQVETIVLGADASTDIEIDKTGETAPNDTLQTETSEQALASERETSAFWGVAPGEAIPLKWDDLLPEAAEEGYLRQQEDFYAMLEQRNRGNMIPFSQAGGTTPDIAEGSELDVMPQFGTFDVVAEFDRQLVRIPGYVVPLDFEAGQRQSAFLFVPYMGACLHTPPPPPNQIIFVEADPAVQVKDIWVPYWLEGELRTQESRNDMGDAAYTLKLDKLDTYEGD